MTNYLTGVRRAAGGYLDGGGIAPAGCVVTGISINFGGPAFGIHYKQLQIGTGAGVWRNVWDA